jgi:Helix-hairpin-helix motif
MAKDAKPAGKVDINSASLKDLIALPGVGSATAKKIVAARPYTAVADLSKAGVSQATIDKLTPLVIVGPAQAAAAPAPATPPVTTAAGPATTAAGPATTLPSSLSPLPSPAAAQTPPVKGMVWVNTSSKVFHREGDRWYGKTKHGKFMTEADAIAAGFREAKDESKKKPAQ